MGDSAYTGQTPVIEEHAPWAADLTQRRGRGYKYLSQTQRAIKRKRSKVRARVEHAIGVIKRVFGFVKVRYRGRGCLNFCVRGINMTYRTIYAEQDEVEECGHCGQECGTAEDSQ